MQPLVTIRIYSRVQHSGTDTLPCAAHRLYKRMEIAAARASKMHMEIAAARASKMHMEIAAARASKTHLEIAAARASKTHLGWHTENIWV